MGLSTLYMKKKGFFLFHLMAFNAILRACSGVKTSPHSPLLYAHNHYLFDENENNANINILPVFYYRFFLFVCILLAVLLCSLFYCCENSQIDIKSGILFFF